jgi:hypothetical protein
MDESLADQRVDVAAAVGDRADRGDEDRCRRPL